MATQKQKKASKANIRKAHEKWQSMSGRAHSLAQPEGRTRKKPGTSGEGDYFHVVVRPKEQFKTFRTQDIGEKGHIQRIAGKRESGSWDTVKWLISKEDAHVESNKLVADTREAEEVLETLESVPKFVRGDIFQAKARRNVPEKEKPTAAQKSAQRQNIKKAQARRHEKASA